MPLDIFVDQSVLQLAVTFSAPLLLAAIGELIIERSGILNVSIEGMMLVSASAGFISAHYTNSIFIGMIVGMLSSALFGLVLGYFSVYLKANQIIIGLGLLILGMGLSSLMYRLIIGVRTLAPKISVLRRLEIPVLVDIPYLGEILFDQPILVYISYLIVPIVAFILYKTPLGLHIRACGENPRAVDTVGISVTKIRFFSTIAGSAIIGLAGFFIPAVLTGSFSDNMIGGRGWLSLQLVIFGRWMPYLILSGSLFFAYIESLQFRMAMVSKLIPSQFFLMLPYISAIIVIIWVSQRAESPENLLQPYDRESR